MESASSACMPHSLLPTVQEHSIMKTGSVVGSTTPSPLPTVIFHIRRTSHGAAMRTSSRIFYQVDNRSMQTPCSPTSEWLGDEQNGRNTMPTPTKWAGKELRHAAEFSDVQDCSPYTDRREPFHAILFDIHTGCSSLCTVRGSTFPSPRLNDFRPPPPTSQYYHVPATLLDFPLRIRDQALFLYF